MASKEGYSNHFGFIYEEDVIPLFGGVLYQVKSMSGKVLSGKVIARVNLRRLDDGQRFGISIDYDSYILPLGGSMHLGKAMLKLEKIESAASGSAIGVVVFIPAAGSERRQAEAGVNQSGELKLQSGDSVYIEGKFYRIKRIIPREPEKGITGWMEFDSNGTVEKPPPRKESPGS